MLCHPPKYTLRKMLKLIRLNSRVKCPLPPTLPFHRPFPHKTTNPLSGMMIPKALYAQSIKRVVLMLSSKFESPLCTS